MGTFTYTALNKKEKFVKGRLEAKNNRAATAVLEADGFLIVNLKEEKAQSITWFQNIFNNVTRLDRIFFTRHLHTMLESGIALDQAIKVTSEQVANPKFKAVLLDIHHRVLEGQSLSSTLERHPRFFTSFYISIIKVGERSGKLDEVLAQLLEQQESDYELITRARNSMTYPIVIIVALILMVTMMMVFVIPKVTGILTQYEVDLPLATKILIGLSNFLIRYGIFLIPVVIALGFLWRRLLRTTRVKWSWDGLMLKLPFAKNIVKEFNIARITRSLSALLKSGIGFDEAIRLTSTVTGNSHYRQSLAEGIRFVQKGVGLAEVLKGYPKLYPPITTRMVEVGEKTGKLDHMLTRLAMFYEKSVTNTLSNLASVIEPVLLLFVGLVVAFVAISVLTPIWKFSETI